MTADEVRAHIDPMRHEFAESRSLVLPALKFAQSEKGFLDRDDLQAVADAVGLTAAYVESVASFYDRIYLQPTGKRIVSVCVTLSCLLRGSDELLRRIEEREGLPGGVGTTDDGELTVQHGQCLGYCDRAPCVQVDVDETVGPLSPDDVERLLDDLRAAERPEKLWR